MRDPGAFLGRGVGVGGRSLEQLHCTSRGTAQCGPSMLCPGPGHKAWPSWACVLHQHGLVTGSGWELCPPPNPHPFHLRAQQPCTRGLFRFPQHTLLCSRCQAPGKPQNACLILCAFAHAVPLARTTHMPLGSLEPTSNIRPCHTL